MSEIISTQLFSWAVYAILLFVLCLFFMNRIERIGRLCLQGVMGVSFILIINCIAYKFDLCLGINIYTTAFASVFGMPGIGLMYLMLGIVT